MTDALDVQHDNYAALKSSDGVAFNSEAERRFCALVEMLVLSESSITPEIVYQEAAFELNISTTTAKRYLLKYTARRAPFGISAAGFVFLK